MQVAQEGGGKHDAAMQAETERGSGAQGGCLAWVVAVLRRTAIAATPGMVLFAVWIVNDQTFLAWRAGPQVVGFRLAHSYWGLPCAVSALAAGISALAALGIALVLMVRRRMKVVPGGKLADTFALGAWGWVVLLIPHSCWNHMFVERIAESKHAPAFLYLAVSEGDTSLLQQLVRRGVSVQHRDALGETALHIAAKRGRVDAVEVLLEGGADVNARNAAGKTPLDLAADAGADAIRECLMSAGGGTASPGRKRRAGRGARREVGPWLRCCSSRRGRRHCASSSASCSICSRTSPT